LTDVEIVYSRPSRGRAVFGNLVPLVNFGEQELITFRDDVIIDGKSLKKGKYALYTIPNIQSWEVILYFDRQLGYTKFNEANVALRTVVKEATPKAIETFTIGINGLDKICLFRNILGILVLL
jgi:hypothetical protein